MFSTQESFTRKRDHRRPSDTPRLGWENVRLQQKEESTYLTPARSTFCLCARCDLTRATPLRQVHAFRSGQKIAHSKVYMHTEFLSLLKCGSSTAGCRLLRLTVLISVFKLTATLYFSYTVYSITIGGGCELCDFILQSHTEITPGASVNTFTPPRVNYLPVQSIRSPAKQPARNS